ncbi:putative isomerase YbhE [Lentithecium fluviatile CBS 122367]|uniref:Putative isomerase YbhE n=1 Tax=Lentithecium fluviatile CBS 122367 TaxID=1168545 RepID=A0A6G1IC08_9PLEO|nr:putative isomerase YbhE [Lentithecium fluviatile CBS 122367]
MKRRLHVSGNRTEFTTLELNLSKKELHVLANYAAPHNASWIETSSLNGNIDGFIGLSEGDDAGLLYTFEIDHDQKTCTMTSCLPTLGAPGHFITLCVNSALAVITYLGGCISFYPFSDFGLGSRLEDTPRTEIIPEFPYNEAGHGPNLGRQWQYHPHQVIGDKRGLLYVPDLGSDRVWIVRRDGTKLDICGWLQCPAGSGPRHAVLTPKETSMYVIGELSHTITAFDLSTSPTEAIQPIEGFAPNVIPPTVYPDHQSMMNSSELCLHPTIPNVLYVSNRWERHIVQREPQVKDVPKELPPGDTVAVVLLSNDGRRVERITHVRTKVDVIRGMRLSDDGKYVVVVGQEGGGVEVYEISGQRGGIWALVAGMSKGLIAGLKHAIWL